MTFSEALERFLASDKLDAPSNEKHRAQWHSTLRTYALPVLGKKRMADISASDIKEVLDPSGRRRTRRPAA